MAQIPLGTLQQLFNAVKNQVLYKNYGGLITARVFGCLLRVNACVEVPSAAVAAFVSPSFAHLDMATVACSSKIALVQTGWMEIICEQPFFKSCH